MVSKSSFFDVTCREGHIFREKGIFCAVRPNGLSRSRFECAVRKRAKTEAVERNHIKRWLRELFRKHNPLFPQGLDMVLVVTQLPEKISFKKMELIFSKLCKRLTE